MSESGATSGQNPVLATIQQPRVLLILLGVWAVVGALSQFFVNSGIFLDIHNRELDGLLGARALGWQGLALAALYFYAARDPDRYYRVFWLAIIDLGASIVAAVYHWGADTFSLESVSIPVIVSAALIVLVFLHLFQPKEEASDAP